MAQGSASIHVVSSALSQRSKGAQSTQSLFHPVSLSSGGPVPIAKEQRFTHEPAPRESGMFGGPCEQKRGHPRGRGFSLRWEGRLEG